MRPRIKGKRERVFIQSFPPKEDAYGMWIPPIGFGDFPKRTCLSSHLISGKTPPFGGSFGVGVRTRKSFSDPVDFSVGKQRASRRCCEMRKMALS